MIKAVIFDMDGLMYDTEPMVEKCWKSAARHSKLTMTSQTLSALRCRSSEDREKYLKGIFGDRIDYRRLERQMYKELHTQIATRGLPLKPGLWELLVYLRRNGYRLAVQTTNSMDTALWYLNLSGCMEFFDVVVTGHSIKHGKPEPDAYTKAVDELKEEPEECLVLEDSPAGIIGAHRAGCLSVMIPDLDEPTRGTQALAQGIVHDLEKVIDFLRAMPHLPETPLPEIHNAVFDLGGVLVDFAPRAYLRDRFSDKKLEEYIYQNVFGNKLWKEIDAGNIDRPQADRLMLEKARKDGRLFEVQTVLDEWRDLLRTKEETVSLIRRLKAQGCHVFYLSNISKDIYEQLETRGLMQLFEGGVCSYEKHLLKPDPAIYAQLMERCGIKPEETVYFDDTRENVEEARSLGFLALHFHSAALAEKNLEGYQIL